MAPKAPRVLDSKIQDALSAVVNDDSLDDGELTVRNIRAIVEQRLSLPDGFLKKDKKWNEKSREIIDLAWAKKSEFHNAASSPEEQLAPIEPAERNKKRRQQDEQPVRKRAKKAVLAAAESDGDDEEPVNPAPVRRRHRQVVDSEEEEDEEPASRVEGSHDASQKPLGEEDQLEASPKDTGVLDSELSSLIDEPPTRKRNKISAATKEPAKAGSDSELSSLIDEPPARKTKKAPAPTKISGKAPPNATAKADSDSELSSLIDEPPTRKQKKPAAPTKKSAKPPPKVSANAESDSELSSAPDSDSAPAQPPKRGKKEPQAAKSKPKPGSAATADDQLKTLQGQLLKCGIRKQWKRELACFATERAMAAHLRGLLREVGMTGRFSERRAREIRERRELEGEMRDAAAFERQWGLEAEEAERQAKEKRKSTAEVYAELGFGSDDEGE